jgi:hypothetical protein
MNAGTLAGLGMPSQIVDRIARVESRFSCLGDFTTRAPVGALGVPQHPCVGERPALDARDIPHGHC